MISPHIINLTSKGDDRGSLTVAEAGIKVPFQINRVYWLHGTKPGVDRGFHSHNDLEQVLVAVSGSCEIEVDDGKVIETYSLNSPAEGLYMGPGIWRVMRNFSPECVLMVMASHLYDESDYIRDYDDFKQRNQLSDECDH